MDEIEDEEKARALKEFLYLSVPRQNEVLYQKLCRLESGMELAFSEFYKRAKPLKGKG